MSVKGIYGLSGSGIDVESMVKAGMLSKQSQYDSMYKKEVKNSWIKSEYSSFYTSMYTFKYTTMSNYKMQSTMNAMSASSSDSTVISATANGAAAAMTHKVAVKQLASNAYLMSKGTITRDSMSSSSSIYLKDNILGSMTAQATYTIGGTTYDADKVTINTTDDATTYTVDGTTYSASDVTVNAAAKYSIQKKAGDYSDLSATKITYNSKEYTASQLSMDSDGNLLLDSTKVDKSALSFTTSDGSTYTGDNIRLNTTSTTTNGTTSYTISSLTGYTTSTASASDKAISYTISDGTTSKTLSYTYQELADGKTLNDLASDINSSGVNITAKYDSTNDSFSLYNKDGGSANTISITTGDTGSTTLFNNLGLASTDGTTMGAAITFVSGTAAGTKGTDGIVTIDGKEYSGLTSNKKTVDGVTYTFNNVSSYTTASDGTKTYATTSVAVSQDTDSIIASVKQFVSDYNTMLDSLNDKYYETQYSDYAPLTSSQESSMTEAQITKWNEKAKSGLLYHSSIIRNIVSSMREAIYTPVDSVDSDYNSASAIGITSSNNKGHLTLDEDKLKEALTADPDCVYQIFASDQDESTTSTSSSVSSFKAASNYKNTGLANRLYDVMTTSMDTISDYAGTSDETDDQSYLGTLITNLQTRMSSFKTQMDAYEDLLYKKYDAMETAIATLSSQLSSVTGSNS